MGGGEGGGGKEREREETGEEHTILLHAIKKCTGSGVITKGMNVSNCFVSRCSFQYW